MTEPQGHPGTELHLLVDGRLEPARRAAVEIHLAGCPRCRREMEALHHVKAALREDLPEHPVPPRLAARVSGALAAAAAPRTSRRRPILIGGLALAAAAALALLLPRTPPDLVEAAMDIFAAYQAATLPMELQTSEPATLERHLAGGRLAFATRVFDFGMMGYRLTGGGVHRLAGRPSALFAYQGEGNRVLCQMYQGNLLELPPPAEEREHDGIRFLIYRRAGLTLVFWQEGTVVCMLVADGDPETAIQLAYAKAVTI